MKMYLLFNQMFSFALHPCWCINLCLFLSPLPMWGRGHWAFPWYYQVAGERYVYKFVCDPEALFSMAFPDNQRPLLKTDMERHINEEDTVPLSHFDESMAYMPEGGCCNPHPYNEGYVY